MERIEAQPLRELGDKSGLVGGTKRAFADIWKRRELLRLLINRELKARYKDSNLGFVWSLFKPLSQLLIYFIVIGQFLGASRGIPSFAIFVFTGLTAWGFFLETVTGGTRVNCRQLRFGEEGLPSTRDFPALDAGNVSGELGDSAGHSAERHRGDGCDPVARAAGLPAARSRRAGRVRDPVRAASVRAQRLHARHPAPH